MLLTFLALPSVGQAQWVQFDNDTANRLSVADVNLVQIDGQEKEYGYADFDQDGDIDLVIVRKVPHLVAGPLRNVLLINENGVLTDRTTQFATASDVAGDQGFLTPTNDRDVAIVDVDLDGWLDLVTGATISPGQPKHIGHPRVYRNLGCSGACNGTEDWLGFRHEDARIPEMLSWSEQSGHNPCVCGVSAGDVDGDGYPDLFLVDYDDGCNQPGADFNSRLLINQGAANPGYFTDDTKTRFLGTVGGAPFPVNVDSLSGAIVDLNNDGRNEVLLESEGIIDVAYNDPANEGVFDTYGTIAAFSTYFVTVADLNNDDLLDLVTTDDGTDRYYLNQGLSNDEIPIAGFLSFPVQYQHTGAGGPASDDGFGDDARVADLDKDGWPDVITADRDFTLPGCNRRAHIYRNLGGNPGGNVVLQEQTSGSGCQTFLGNPATCMVAGIPADQLVGTDDVAIFDINGDSWLDLVIGSCSGTEVYMNSPPVGPAGSVPDGDNTPGTMLMLDRNPGESQISLSWGESCTLDDTDYSVYEGTIGDFSGHAEVTCSTGGTPSHVLQPGGSGTYYLIVPHNGTFEGDYGKAGDGSSRGQGSSACRPMNAQSCE